MNILYLLIFLFVLSSPIYAEQKCVSFSIDEWTSRQKNLRNAVAYILAYEAGQDIIPSVQENLICFESPNFNIEYVICDDIVDGICDGKKILNRIKEQENKYVNEQNQRQIDESEFETIVNQLKSDDTNWESMTTAQKIITIKNLLRYEVLRNKLNKN